MKYLSSCLFSFLFSCSDNFDNEISKSKSINILLSYCSWDIKQLEHERGKNDLYDSLLYISQDVYNLSQYLSKECGGYNEDGNIKGPFLKKKEYALSIYKLYERNKMRIYFIENKKDSTIDNIGYFFMNEKGKYSADVINNIADKTNLNLLLDVLVYCDFLNKNLNRILCYRNTKSNTIEP